MTDNFTREHAARAIVQHTGRAKNQAAGLAAGFSDEQIAAIGKAVAVKNGVEAAINAALDANADAELARQQAEKRAKESQARPVAPLVVGPPMAGAPRLADDATVGPPRTE